MMNDTKRVSGKIIHLDDTGWGFVTTPEMEFTRIFFHWTGLVGDTLNFKELKRNMKVEFIPVAVEGKGWRAMRIKVVEDD